MKKIVIFGSGDYAKVLFSEINNQKEYKFIGFVNEKEEDKKIITVFKKKKHKNIGSIKDCNKIQNLYGIIGVADNYTRKKIYKKISLLDINIKWESIISKKSIIQSNVIIGSGSAILSNVNINTGTKIGNHCIINSSTTIEHDNNIANFVSTGPGVITGGNVKIKDNSFVGIGSVISHNIIINKNTIIGASSFVNKDCLSNSVYFGIPVKKIRDRKENDKYL